MTPRQRIAFRILFFLYLAGVLFLCFGKFRSNPSVPLELFGIPTDKLVHFGMFFPFPILAFLAFDHRTDSVPATLACTGITLILGLILAGGTEWGQAVLTDYRSGDRLDFAADAVALVCASVLVAVWDIRKQKR